MILIQIIDIKGEGSKIDASVFTIYHILKISERVVEKHAGRTGAMNILSEGLGQSKELQE